MIVDWTQIYFALLIYSFAYHLRNGSYRHFNGIPFSYTSVPGNLEGDDDEEHSTFQNIYSSQQRHAPHSSAASWTDFVTAPKRKRSAVYRENGGPYPDEVDEVLFDEDEAMGGGGIGSSGHSKLGTEETTSISTNGDEQESDTRMQAGGGSDRNR